MVNEDSELEPINNGTINIYQARISKIENRFKNSDFRFDMNMGIIPYL